VCSSDRHRIYQ